MTVSGRQPCSDQVERKETFHWLDSRFLIKGRDSGQPGEADARGQGEERPRPHRARHSPAPPHVRQPGSPRKSSHGIFMKVLLQGLGGLNHRPLAIGTKLQPLSPPRGWWDRKFRPSSHLIGASGNQPRDLSAFTLLSLSSLRKSQGF